MRISVEAAEPGTTSYEPSPGQAGTSEPGRAWPWPACGWGGLVTPKNRWLVGTARYRRGGPCREVGLNAGGGDAFLRLVRLAGRLACSAHGGWADLCQFDGDACLGAPQDAGPCSGAVAARRWHRRDPGGEHCPRPRTWPCRCGCGRRRAESRSCWAPYQLDHRRLVQAGMAASTRAAAMVRAAVSALGSRSIQALIPAPS